MLEIFLRRRLVNAIANSASPITYIFGPSGFGKSTLAGQYLQFTKGNQIWFDGRATTTAHELLSDLSAAIVAALPELAEKFSKFDDRESLNASDVAEYLEILSKVKTPFTLVIDSAEEISAQHNEISLAFIRGFPGQHKLILIRSSSPTIANLKEFGFDRFQIISPEELRFTKSEFDQFAKTINSTISNKHLDTLFDFTEGWPQGCALVMEIFQGLESQEIGEFYNQLKRDGKSRISNLAHKALAQCSSDEVKTLLNCALLDQIKPGFALAITDNVNSIQHLTRLAIDSIIVTQIAQNPPRFRINPLVRDALMVELVKSSQYEDVFARTVAVLTADGEIKTLAGVLLESGDTPKLRELVNRPETRQSIDESIAAAVMRSAVGELRQWIRLTEFVEHHRKFAHHLLSLYAEVLDGNLDLAKAHLIGMREILEGDAKYEKLRGNALAAESVLAFVSGDFERNKSLAIQAYELLPKSEGELRGHQISYLQLASLAAFFTDDDHAIFRLQEILEEISTTKLSPSRITQVLGMRALLLAFQGRFIESQNNLVSHLDTSSEMQPSGLFGAFGIRIARAMTLSEAGDRQASLRLHEENLHEAHRYRVWPIVIASHHRISYELILQGNREDALRHIQVARELIDQQVLSPQLHRIIDLAEARIRLFTGEHDRAYDLVKRCMPSYMSKALEIAILIAKRSTRTGELVDQLPRRMPKQALTFHLFRAHLLSDDPGPQQREVKQALEIGSSNGYFNHFLTQRTDVMQNYIKIAAESPTVFHERLAREAGVRIGEMLRRSTGGGALTRREADILRHLSTQAPIKEIAASLSISHNTIKTHLKNLYKKLGAADRDEAVLKGRELLRI